MPLAASSCSNVCSRSNVTAVAGGALTVRRIAACSRPTKSGCSQIPRKGPSRRIVVVEDNPDIRETLRLLLTLWGHEVSMADDGPSGVERITQDRPDIALIDVGLPLLNGYDVARAIRKILPGPEVRLIAVTGYGQPADKELAMQAGFDTH